MMEQSFQLQKIWICSIRQRKIRRTMIKMMAIMKQCKKRQTIIKIIKQNLQKEEHFIGMLLIILHKNNFLILLQAQREYFY